MVYISRTLATLVGAASLGLMSLSTVAVAFEPTKPINFIIMAGKGGGADKMARLMPVSYTHLTLPTIYAV